MTIFSVDIRAVFTLDKNEEEEKKIFRNDPTFKTESCSTQLII